MWAYCRKLEMQASLKYIGPFWWHARGHQLEPSRQEGSHHLVTKISAVTPPSPAPQHVGF